MPAQLHATTSSLGPTLPARYADIEVPLLAMHGTADLMADPQATIDLVECAGSTDWSLHLVDGAFHALLRVLDRDACLRRIAGWIAERPVARDGPRSRHGRKPERS